MDFICINTSLYYKWLQLVRPYIKPVLTIDLDDSQTYNNTKHGAISTELFQLTKNLEPFLYFPELWWVTDKSRSVRSIQLNAIYCMRFLGLVTRYIDRHTGFPHFQDQVFPQHPDPKQKSPLHSQQQQHEKVHMLLI